MGGGRAREGGSGGGREREGDRDGGKEGGGWREREREIVKRFPLHVIHFTVNQVSRSYPFS